MAAAKDKPLTVAALIAKLIGMPPDAIILSEAGCVGHVDAVHYPSPDGPGAVILE